jgi:Cytochrome c554 and c-prime
MNLFKDTGHLLRFAALFVIAFLLFWAIRGFVVPRTFGQYGHYRGAAIGEIASRPAQYAGHDACETCHSDVLDLKKAGRHAHVNCEACHGAQAKHAADPGTFTPAKLDTATLCVRCHSISAARPKNFPQVNVADHANGVPCETCHQPHSPAIGASPAVTGGAK